MTGFEGGREKLSHVTVVLLALEACKTLEAYKSFQAHKALQAKDKRKTSEGQDHRNMSQLFGGGAEKLSHVTVVLVRQAKDKLKTS